MPQGRREETVQGSAPRAVLCLPRSRWQGRLEVDLPCQVQGQHGQSALGKTAQWGPSFAPVTSFGLTLQLTHHFLEKPFLTPG